MNILGALTAYVAYLAVHLPFLRMVVGIQLLVAAAALIAPSVAGAHDGSRLTKALPLLVPVLTLLIAVVSALLANGSL